jgi:4-hydroxyphenylpyruvate dioxygenase
MTNDNERIKLTNNVTREGKTTVIDDYLKYNHGPGVQHIAIRTDNIVEVVSYLLNNGIEFIPVKSSYYKNISNDIKNNCKIEIKEKMETLEKYNITIDFNSNGYVLQAFTKSVTDRPTLIFEFIQRNNHPGFGTVNFLKLLNE